MIIGILSKAAGSSLMVCINFTSMTFETVIYTTTTTTTTTNNNNNNSNKNNNNNNNNSNSNNKFE